ncbi:integrase catalytic domain-containing protein [Nephila pilipes]|uniref:Integrase catalytic domain-containing protein n=1 Tax=Nephila pilipes TaxID=299642 RepID=A0A8X6NX18_NEPPI|nr:integrase catalytic domain-containing protein [Nephila pilipes]
MIVKKLLFWLFAKIIELIPGRDGKIRTAKFKTQHGTLLRPVQRIYPFDIYSKESVDEELGGEESNSYKVTDIENNLTSADAVILRKFTSSRRPMKVPKGLDLFNNIGYTLETFFESLKGGGEIVGYELK